MCNSREERKEVAALVKKLSRFLRREGYDVKVSKQYTNRRNEGIRIYITAEKSETPLRVKVKA